MKPLLMTSIKDSHVSVTLVSCAHGGVIPWCPLDIINHWLWERNLGTEPTMFLVDRNW